MILARESLKSVAAPLVLALALATAPAHADVMEVDADGARWVAGGSVAPAEMTLPASDGHTDLNSFIVPERIIADTRAHAVGVPPRYAAKIAELSHRFDLSPSLLEALVWQESRWRENAVSHAGARGLDCQVSWSRPGRSDAKPRRRGALSAGTARPV